MALYKCPDCGAEDDVDVTITCDARLCIEDDEIVGTLPDESDNGDHEWGDDSTMTCRECRHSAAAKEFAEAASPEDQEHEAPTTVTMTFSPGEVIMLIDAMEVLDPDSVAGCIQKQTLLARLYDSKLDEPAHPPCAVCGHSYEDHSEGDVVEGRCWHGSGDGDRCECQEYEAPEEQPDEPSQDDTVKCCPECETPNQFGELCARCAREERELCE